MTPNDILREKVASLEQQLLSAHPQIPSLLRDIHNQLREDPDCVTILTEEEIGVVVQGLMRQTQVSMVENISKKGTGKALKKTTVADLGL